MNGLLEECLVSSFRAFCRYLLINKLFVFLYIQEYLRRIVHHFA